MKKRDGSKPEGESRYAQKQRLKYGNGVVSPRWMSWSENPSKPRKRGVA